MRTRLAVVVAASALGLSACTGVPTSSDPVIVKKIKVGPPTPPAIHPYHDEPARNIVRGFLQANGTQSSQPASAQSFLTTSAGSRWSAGTATIISDELVGSFRKRHSKIVVSGREVGTLDVNGVYHPSPQGTGRGGTPIKLEYGIKKVGDPADPQYRIDDPFKGLVLTVGQFEHYYKRRALYFFDLAERYLVPDIRWSALSGVALERWLVTQLAVGPSANLQSSVKSDTLPNQPDPSKLTVLGGAITRIAIPGAAQLAGGARSQLAAQIALTLDNGTAVQRFEIIDGRKPIRIDAADGPSFTASNFAGDKGPQTPSAPEVYYLRNGKIISSGGVALDGDLNDGTYGYLTSLALTHPVDGPLTAAATNANGRLLIGTQAKGLQPTGLQGELTRPDWVANQDEAWVGDGKLLFRVSAVPHKMSVQRVQVDDASSIGRIVALRVSPEGSRIAIVGQSGGARKLYVGSIVRSAGQVRVVSAQPISPDGVSVNDVAWVEPLRLIAIGRQSVNHDPRIFEVNVDGSELTPTPIGSLPPQLQTVTSAPNQLAWVGAGGGVWEQIGQSWTSPVSPGQTTGAAPVYVE